jgi:hypothetical protein
MSETTLANMDDTARTRAENWVRAAGVATIVSGVLFSVMAFLLAQAVPATMAVAVSSSLGIVLAVLGVLTLRLQTWSLWAAIFIATFLLGCELWVAYGGGRKPAGETLSIFLLVIPLLVLVINVLAVGAARALLGRPSAP